jgi:uncharacterized membrane protein
MTEPRGDKSPELTVGAQTPDSPVALEPKKALALILLHRVELVWTLLLDTGAIVVSLYCEGWVLRVIARTVESQASWEHRLIAFVFGIGMVGTVVCMTVFDLGKRVIASYRDLRDEWQRR